MRNTCKTGMRPSPPRRPTRTEVRAIALLLGLTVGLWTPSGPVRSAGAQVPVTPAPAVPATPTPLPATAVPVATPAPTTPPAPIATRPPAPVVTPAAPPPTATRPAPVAQPTPAPTTAPRAGGIPLDLAFGLLGAGAATLAAGLALLRRGRRHR